MKALLYLDATAATIDLQPLTERQVLFRCTNIRPTDLIHDNSRLSIHPLSNFSHLIYLIHPLVDVAAGRQHFPLRQPRVYLSSSRNSLDIFEDPEESYAFDDLGFGNGLEFSAAIR